MYGTSTLRESDGEFIAIAVRQCSQHATDTLKRLSLIYFASLNSDVRNKQDMTVFMMPERCMPVISVPDMRDVVFVLFNTFTIPYKKGFLMIVFEL
jgi:hypothetical protein